jgi:hypothetical protein
MAERRRFIAYHEAGHAVAQHRLGFTSLGCTITPANDYAGLASHMDDDFAFATRADDGVYEIPPEKTRDLLIVNFAGYCAQIQAGDTEEMARIGASEDFETAEERRLAIGLSEDDCIKLAGDFVREASNWLAIEAIAEELLLRETLGGDEVDILFDVLAGECTRADLDNFRRLRDG